MITEMRTPFPSRIIRYIHKTSTKKTVWSFGWAESPTRTNSFSMVSLLLSILHIPLLLQHSMDDRKILVNTVSVRAMSCKSHNLCYLVLYLRAIIKPWGKFHTVNPGH